MQYSLVGSLTANMQHTYYSALRWSLIFRSLETGDDVRFEEFVQYVLQEGRPGPEHLDRHWRLQYNLCQPCHVNYDFIGHYETLRQDAEHVLRQISRHSNNADVQFPATDLDSRNRNSQEFLQKFYGNVPTNSIRRLLQLYKRDYDVFGFKFPDIILRKLNIQSKVSSRGYDSINWTYI